jgi:hypothetical protein
MAVVQVKKKPDPLPVACTSIPDGRYLIKNRAVGIYWSAEENPMTTVNFCLYLLEAAKECNHFHWDITHDTDHDGNISIKSLYDPSSWVGADLTGSMVPVSWRLIQADSKSYYLTMDMNRKNPRVPEARVGFFTLLSQVVSNTQSPVRVHFFLASGCLSILFRLQSVDTFKEGDQRQMW